MSSRHEGVARIVEVTDATPEELAIREVNSSVYVFAADQLWSALEHLDADNAQGELYLTDAVRHLVDDGRAVAVYRAEDPRVGEGVNTRADLAAAGAQLRDGIVSGHLEAGVTVVDPATTWIEPEVEIVAARQLHVPRGRQRHGVRPEGEFLDRAHEGVVVGHQRIVVDQERPKGGNALDDTGHPLLLDQELEGADPCVDFHADLLADLDAHRPVAGGEERRATRRRRLVHRHSPITNRHAHSGGSHA